jgi:DNA-binding response OmpR family regulator
MAGGERMSDDENGHAELPGTVTRGVVVVEQDPNCASAWAAALAQLGRPVAVVSEPAVAIASRKFAVFVLGSMPDGTYALDVARDLALLPTGRRPRVVLVTREPPRRVDRIYVDALLDRPVRIEQLVMHVRRLMAHGGPEHGRRDLRRT